jgi:2-polyprenyl-6-hydroxyphenyl methylase / 3-demethylubiquinone-9 3-methyltransferase
MSSNLSNEEVNKFSDHHVHWWDTTGPMKTLHHINPTRLSYVEQHIELKQKTLLDVGCGGGIFAEALAKKNAIVTAIDANLSAIQAAKQHAACQKLNINYQHGILEELTLANSFDVVTCMELLEHVPNPAALIQHCVEYLKPDGLLFLSTINRTLKAYGLAVIAAEYLLGIVPKKTHDYEKFIRPSECEAMLSMAGCTLIGLSGMGYNPFTAKAWLDQQVDVNYLLCAKKVV